MGESRSKLSYRWGTDLDSLSPLQDSPAPPRDTTVCIIVGARQVSIPNARVTVTPHGGTPQVREGKFTVTANNTGSVVWEGDVTEELRAWARWCALQALGSFYCPEELAVFLRDGGEVPIIVFPGIPIEQWKPGERAAWFACEAHCKETHIAASLAAINAVDAMDSDAPRQAAHLRTLLLRRALPHGLWPLIDSDERVLCDALLERV